MSCTNERPVEIDSSIVRSLAGLMRVLLCLIDVLSAVTILWIVVCLAGLRFLLFLSRF